MDYSEFKELHDHVLGLNTMILSSDLPNRLTTSLERIQRRAIVLKSALDTWLKIYPHSPLRNIPILFETQ